MDIPKISQSSLDAACAFQNEENPAELEELAVQGTTEFAATQLVTAFEKHVQRNKQARDARHKDIHYVRISANRWELWDDPWLDSSSSRRCSSPVICSAGRGGGWQRSQLPSATLRSKSARDLHRDASPSPRPGNKNGMVTPRIDSGLHRDTSPCQASGMGSPRARQYAPMVSPRSMGRGAKGTRLPGNVLSRMCKPALPKCPEPGTASLPALPSHLELLSPVCNPESILAIQASPLAPTETQMVQEGTASASLEERAKQAAATAAELQVLACLARTEAVELHLAVQQNAAVRLAASRDNATASALQEVSELRAELSEIGLRQDCIRADAPAQADEQLQAGQRQAPMQSDETCEGFRSALPPSCADIGGMMTV